MRTPVTSNIGSEGGGGVGLSFGRILCAVGEGKGKVTDFPTLDSKCLQCVECWAKKKTQGFKEAQL